MKYRRTSRLAWTPLLALTGCGYVYVARSAASITVVVILAAVWLPWAIDDFFRTLVISEDALRMRGLFRRPVVILKNNVGACHYRRFHSRGTRTWPEMAYVEVRNPHGDELHVWRFGWGRRRRELFGRLNAWIEASGFVIDEPTRRFLEAGTLTASGRQ